MPADILTKLTHDNFQEYLNLLCLATLSVSVQLVPHSLKAASTLRRVDELDAGDAFSSLPLCTAQQSH